MWNLCKHEPISALPWVLWRPLAIPQWNRHWPLEQRLGLRIVQCEFPVSIHQIGNPVWHVDSHWVPGPTVWNASWHSQCESALRRTSKRTRRWLGSMWIRMVAKGCAKVIGFVMVDTKYTWPPSQLLMKKICTAYYGQNPIKIFKTIYALCKISFINKKVVWIPCVISHLGAESLLNFVLRKSTHLDMGRLFANTISNGEIPGWMYPTMVQSHKCVSSGKRSEHLEDHPMVAK